MDPLPGPAEGMTEHRAGVDRGAMKLGVAVCSRESRQGIPSNQRAETLTFVKAGG